MAKNIGTLISAPIRPNDSLDDIPVAYSSEIKGGLHTVTSSTDRDNIIFSRREWGMLCYVINDDKIYQLRYNYKNTDITDNLNWVPLNINTSNNTEWVNSVIRKTNIPPSSPSNNDRFLITAPATGVWSGHENKIAQWDSVLSTWQYTIPTNGMTVRVDNEDNVLYKYEGNFPSGVWNKELLNQIRYIVATSSNGINYSAVSTPDFGTYSQDVVFLVNFLITNSTTYSTININSNGNIPIKKVTKNGLENLKEHDIIPGYVYNIFYDGTNFQINIPSTEQELPSNEYTNILVTAYGSDSYTASSTPSISSLSKNHLYITNFQNTNTGLTSVSLNINNTGTYEIKKIDENSNVWSITVSGEISTTHSYYLIWNGNYFQMFDSNPISSNALLYTNLIPSIEVGSIDFGSTFSDMSIKDMWDTLILPKHHQANFNYFNFNYTGGNLREVGDAITAGTYTFYWNTFNSAHVKPNSITIKDITNSQVLAQGLSNSGTYSIYLSTINKTFSSTHQWMIYGTRTNNTIFKSEPLTITWSWRVFYGENLLTELSLPSEVQSLNSTISTTKNGTYEFNSNGYKYIAFPTSYGEPERFIDYKTNLPIVMADYSDGYNVNVGSFYAQTMTITNAWGCTTDYYIFRTKNRINGPLTINVS